MAARKSFWSKFKKVKTQTLEVPSSGASQEVVEPSPSTAAATEQMALPPAVEPHVATPAEGVEQNGPKEGDGSPVEVVPQNTASPVDQSAAPSPLDVQPTLTDGVDPTTIPAQPTVPVVSPPSSSPTAEALKRLTTIDLENGKTPGSFQQDGASLAQPGTTAILVKVGDGYQAVHVSLSPEQCRAAGFLLVSDAKTGPPVAPKPQNFYQAQNQLALGISAEASPPIVDPSQNGLEPQENQVSKADVPKQKELGGEANEAMSVIVLVINNPKCSMWTF